MKRWGREGVPGPHGAEVPLKKLEARGPVAGVQPRDLRDQPVARRVIKLRMMRLTLDDCKTFCIRKYLYDCILREGFACYGLPVASD